MEGFLDQVRREYRDKLDVELVERAYRYAQKAHIGQNRESGEPYFVHPCAVARILLELEMDSATISAALLHDVVEDTPATADEVRQLFGDEIAQLVSGLTKISKVEYQNTEERQAENIRRMLLAMSNDIRVILIKLADRLHNMRTLQYTEPEKQKRVARETLDIYAPLAHRLGIFSIKCELEDLSLYYLDREGYEEIEHLIQAYSQRESEIAEIIQTIRGKLEEMGIKGHVDGRTKHFYSIYKKMHQKEKSFEQIFDIMAVRIVVETLKDCYGALGMVHTMWKPIPGRFKDYIAVPKENLYQSLHTTLMGEHGRPFEVQIRTEEMHRTAEYGIAAHWKYKEQRTNATDLDGKLEWLRSILEWQNDTSDAHEFMDSLKMDLFSGEIFVFTPRSDVINLPAGATPIDFAYCIHSAVGNKCVGARVNGRMVQLDAPLKTGDIVEIITSNSSRGPSRDWLKIAKSPQARSKIRAWFKKECKDENIDKGKAMLEEAFKRVGLPMGEMMRPEWLKKLYKRFTVSSLEDMYAAVGYGGIPAGQIVGRLQQEYKQEVREHQRQALEKLLQGEEPELEAVSSGEKTAAKARSGHGVTVKGYSGMLVRFARCCSPVPNDEIVGFITRGRGVSVHRRDCPNIGDMLKDPSRIIEVAWEGDDNSEYRSQFKVLAYDRPGLFVDITNTISANNVKMQEVNARMDAQGMAEMFFVVEISGKQQLENLMKALKRMPEVKDVFRAAK
ncbi:MAG: bifunctional (p)ppGpp synthetase/guanosine-3',5'-bis(diphosphate) 3'-pyrophosphohydrolase [Eubacteriales bacterium]|nr:bifunctional (p)ppGpp synthetase/guanosine-3',5'-bis(diphosphate) 3'-pyrophosphohydrolase [Eubacteriales bacterium]